MLHTASGKAIPPRAGNRSSVLSILLWLALSIAWLVSVFSVIQEMCMVSACRDTASFTIFGLNMGWFGIAYFSLILIVLWLRNSIYESDWALAVMVYTGIGAELRLLWIQKYIIGGWCPLCVTICCALFFAGILLAVEKLRCLSAGQCTVKGIFGWLVFVAAMITTGLSIALAGVKALV